MFLTAFNYPNKKNQITQIQSPHSSQKPEQKKKKLKHTQRQNFSLIFNWRNKNIIRKKRLSYSHFPYYFQLSERRLKKKT